MTGPVGPVRHGDHMNPPGDFDTYDRDDTVADTTETWINETTNRIVATVENSHGKVELTPAFTRELLIAAGYRWLT